MKAKTFIALLVVLCVLAGAAWFMVQKDRPSSQQTLLGKTLFEDLSVGSIDSIAIQDSEGSVSLKQGKDFWEVVDRYHYRADFSKVNELVKKITAAKIGQRFSSSEEILARLSLHSPDEKEIPPERKGDRIVLKDKSEDVLVDFVIGNDDTRPDTFYIRRTSETDIYLVDQEFKYLDKKPEKWLALNLIDIDEKDVKQVACFDMKAKQIIYMIERPAKGEKPVLLNKPPQKNTIQYKLEQVVGALSPFQIDDVVKPGKTLPEDTFSNTPQFEFRLYNGIIYHIYPGGTIGKDAKQYYFKVAVSYSEPAAKTDNGKETKARAEGENPAVEAERLNKELGAWRYIVSKWVYDSLIKTPEDLFQKEEKDDKA